ncbi:MAG TPA: dTDP-4-dehydrorhamnose reductase [Methylophilaceae bacterium]|jgi:dTDP-4-dehydrorhamnose reductase
MKILLLGKGGQVGWELQRSLAVLGDLFAYDHPEVDFAQPEALRALVQKIQPDFIVNSAAYTAVDKAESDTETARLVNAESVKVLAEEAKKLNAWLIHYSTDYVFDGTKVGQYFEDDLTNPQSVYGKTKCEGEELLRQTHANHLIFRTSWVYAARGGNFAKTMLRLAKDKTELSVVADQIGAPTSAELLADVTALAIQKIQQSQNASSLAGTYHVIASGETSWHEYAQYVFELAIARGAKLSLTPAQVKPIPTEAYPVPAPRPKNSRLNTQKVQQTFAVQLPDWRYHVTRLIDELVGQGAL